MAKTILIVEDSKIQLEILRRILQKNGYDVITASNGRLGLNIALFTKPDIVISDINMPEMNGYELCREIKNNKDINKIPVILLTELKSVTDIIEGLKSQSDDYITKPYNEKYLISKIESYINNTIPIVDATVSGEFEVTYQGTTHVIYSNYRKIFNLLFSTYENVIHQYQEILESKDTLQRLNNELIEQAHVIKESEEMFKFFVQTLPDVVYKIDTDGKFTFINDAIRHYGYEPEELIGEHFSKIFYQDDVKNISREEVLPYFLGKKSGNLKPPKLFDERRSVDRKTFGLEVRLKTKDEELSNKPIISEVSSYGIYKFNADKHIADHDGTLGVISRKLDFCLGSGGIIKDITEKKRIEHALLESEKISHALMENASDAILIADTEGNLLDANIKAVVLLGYSKSELLHMKYTDIHPQDDRGRVINVFQRAIAEGCHHFLETHILRKDGTRVSVEISANIIKINGKILAQGIFRDITERKLSEERHRRQEQLMIYQSKMAAMGEMIGLIAHQWRQPINAIGLIIQDIKDAYDYGEFDGKYVAKAVDMTMCQVNFMSKTIDDFRDFLKPSKLKVRFDVKSTIDKLISMFAQLYKKSAIDITLRAECDVKLFTDGYPNEFNQVILNILNNSRDAITSIKYPGVTPKWGQIEITISNSDDGGKIIILIRDTGGGIPENVIENIFEPYFTTKGMEGTGIGLYMSKTIIETNMGGRLSVKNVEGGAEFMIELAVSKLEGDVNPAFS
ncbi:PAS domain S-box protein [Candidatus Magnetominusculus xianensis]|uniref:histidine kinase n=1 Tax=Candidatus Magnetominusculus xianensis TaxID=1748249 RepID=A0ABR5SFY7_9BACT|nr:PAS domain S-box protein [Candidatus Magnetominusculus xianensis]KWT85003.1 multi-sensor hybrid histidine kinase [Candidatus Magnetominusculus xianensis]MBF0404531.1 PAS domain S-box protein [Nitrospirota bacterium]